MKRSISNSSLQVKPIKLKSLQDARNEAKGLNKNFSLSLSDLDCLVDNLKAMKKTETQKIASKIEEKEENEEEKEDKKNSEQKAENFQSRENGKGNRGRYFFKGKSSISNVFENLEQRNKKKLTREEAKGLVDRLQGRSLFKFT